MPPRSWASASSDVTFVGLTALWLGVSFRYPSTQAGPPAAIRESLYEPAGRWGTSSAPRAGAEPWRAAQSSYAHAVSGKPSQTTKNPSTWGQGRARINVPPPCRWGTSTGSSASPTSQGRTSRMNPGASTTRRYLRPLRGERVKRPVSSLSETASKAASGVGLGSTNAEILPPGTPTPPNDRRPRTSRRWAKRSFTSRLSPSRSCTGTQSPAYPGACPWSHNVPGSSPQRRKRPS